MLLSGSVTLVGLQSASLIEYCYKATKYNIPPSTPSSTNKDKVVPSGWSATLISVSAASPYVWESQRTKEDGESWSPWSTPTLKNNWAEKGDQGARGEQGAKLRMRKWSSSTEYTPGADGDKFYDVVEFEGKLYLCLKKHTAQSGVNDPRTSISQYKGFWEVAQEWTFIATALLLTEKIKASQIDADGLNAKNVSISGRIIATSGSFTGEIIARSGRIGGFTIENGRLDWKQRDYFGSDSRSLKLGASTNNDEGIVDVSFNAATQGRYGVRVLGSNLGGASILAANRVPTSSELPSFGMSYAGFFVGPVFCVDRGHGIAGNIVAATSFRCIKSINSDGSYEYNTGVDWDRGNSPDLDRIRLIVKGGLIVGYYKE